MKLNTVFVAAICAGTLLSSCVNETAKERQLAFSQATLADGDAFQGIQIIGEAALSGMQYAERAEATGQAEASQVKAFYDQLLPELDSLATLLHVVFPITGIPAIGEDDTDSTTATVETDSTLVEDELQPTAAAFDYVDHAQHEIDQVKEQLKRLTRNTNKDVQNFAKNQLPLANELFTAIGGKEEAHGHH